MLGKLVNRVLILITMNLILNFLIYLRILTAHKHRFSIIITYFKAKRVT